MLGTRYDRHEYGECSAHLRQYTPVCEDHLATVVTNTKTVLTFPDTAVSRHPFEGPSSLETNFVSCFFVFGVVGSFVALGEGSGAAG